MQVRIPLLRILLAVVLGLAVAACFTALEFFGVWQSFEGDPNPWFIQVALWPGSWLLVGAQGGGNPWSLAALPGLLNGILYGAIGLVWQLGRTRPWTRGLVLALTLGWLGFVTWLRIR